MNKVTFNSGVLRENSGSLKLNSLNYRGINMVYSGDKPLYSFAVHGYSAMNRCEMLSIWSY